MVKPCRVLARLAALGAFAMAPPAAWTQDPAGGEFAVSAYTNRPQTLSAVASDANGNFVVVWTRYSANFVDRDVFGRRFSATGVPQGAEFQVNVYTTSLQAIPAVAADMNGNFVVVWTSDLQDGDGNGVFGRLFNFSGVPLGGEFAVNSYTTGYQGRPSVALDAAGNFVVVWNSGGLDGSDFRVFGRRFDVAGNPQGLEFAVNANTDNVQAVPDVASDAAGNFVVVWHSYPASGIFARRFDSLGAPQGAEFDVRSDLTGSTVYPDVAMAASGDFTVVWTQIDGEPAGGPGVFGRRFDALGAAQGPQFHVNTYTTAGWFPEVALSARGDFVVAWHAYQPDESDGGVFAERFDPFALPQGTEFRVNSYTTGNQSQVAVASNPDGDFVVAWTSVQPGGHENVLLQRYGDLIFQDGFESSDLTRWSSAQTDGFDLDAAGGAAAMGGTAIGLRAFVNDVNPLFVQDATPNAERRYRVRFYVDPNGFDPGEADGRRRVRVFIGFNGASERLVTVVLRRLGGEYALMARVRRDDGTRADTGFFPITDGPHLIEFDWQRSSTSGANDGQLVLRLDDAVVSTLLGIDNDASPIEFARLGVMTIKTPVASGTVYFDQFESRRLRYIGPEPAAALLAVP